MFENKLKKMLKEGKSAIGTFASMNSPDLVEIMGLTGFDFVIIDAEHGPMDAETSMNLIRAAELHNMTPIVRVRENSETVILKHLDVGAHGIQVPQINSDEDAKLLVQRSKYSPLGKRGVAMPRAADYGLYPIMDYFEKSNEQTMIIAHCENIISLENLEDIAKTSGVDVIFLGPFDMSQSMGIPGQVKHPRIEEAAQRVLEVCKKYDKIPGIFAVTAEDAKSRIEQGFRYVPIGMDCTLIGAAFKKIVYKVK
jgi:4-hydroxy-2-oxoheptanedioate aldolase